MVAGAKPTGSPENKHILVVDDDEVFRETLTAVLHKAGYSVQSAPDYRLALQILEGADPLDLLLVDIVMPDRVNGLALGRMARLRRPDLKIIYISGYDITGVAQEALGAIIRKPLDNDLLLAEIVKTLGNAG